jgi:CubicO group peptidase (beta-lactamase class C family)
MKKVCIVKTIIILFIIQILFINAACTQTTDNKAKRIDSVMSILANRDTFTGSILVAEKGQIIYKNAFGYSDYATKQKLSINSMFELASVSKQFTAMGIMILKERGKLDYGDDIQKYFPKLQYKGITIRNLLWHTSGLPKYERFFDQKWDKSKIAVNDDIWKLFELYNPPVEFNPGEKWAYSNTGYAMLASIIEKVSGKTYKEFLKENIFDKLEMKRTRIVNRRLNPEKLEDYAYGYIFSLNDGGYVLPDNTERFKYVVYLDGIVGDGCVNSTVEDLFKWDRALYTEKLVKKTTLDEAFISGKTNDGKDVNYGFGWSLANVNNIKRISHGGGWPGYSTLINRFPELDRTIIILCINRSFVNIWETIYNILDNKKVEVPPCQAGFQIQTELLLKNSSALKTKIETMINDKENYKFDENQINNIGYDLLTNKRIDEAIEVFILNVRMFPKSANTYDSLGEAYLIAGNKELAIENYEKSLKLNPENKNAAEQIFKLKK